MSDLRGVWESETIGGLTFTRTPTRQKMAMPEQPLLRPTDLEMLAVMLGVMGAEVQPYSPREVTLPDGTRVWEHTFRPFMADDDVGG